MPYLGNIATVTKYYNTTLHSMNACHVVTYIRMYV